MGMDRGCPAVVACRQCRQHSGKALERRRCESGQRRHGYARCGPVWWRWRAARVANMLDP